MYHINTNDSQAAHNYFRPAIDNGSGMVYLHAHEQDSPRNQEIFLLLLRCGHVGHTFAGCLSAGVAPQLFLYSEVVKMNQEDA